MSDNGPQFSSKEMKEFANAYGFTLITSSPHYTQSNGLAEQTIQTVKVLLHKSSGPNMALLSFKATPIPWCSFSSTKLLMGRKIKIDIPTAKTLLTPHWPYLTEFQERDREYKAKQKEHYDQRHRTQTLDPLLLDTPAWITSIRDCTTGQIRSPTATPRSYIMSTPGGEVRRTRQYVFPRSPVMTHSRSGIILRPPD